EAETTFVDELLRYDSPVQMSRRVTLAEYEIDGHKIDKGAILMTALGAANRDPAKWGPTADVLDVRRENAREHMSFGGGFHSCLAHPLARREGNVPTPPLVRRSPDIPLAVEQPPYNGRIVLRGLSELPVTLN